MNFNQFVNQVQFGEVAIVQSTRRCVATARQASTEAKSKGKKVTFTGAFTLSVKHALITPITVEVGA